MTTSKRLQIKIKYGLDRIAACLLMLVASPLMIVIAAAIKLDDRGPVFFRQTRLGLKAEKFSIWKFRTMTLDADQKLDDKGRVLENRITKVGVLLRKTSLDELPQLFNIFAGEMSFIGPRPVLPEHIQRYSDAQKLRFEMKPGITGLAQVSGRNTLKWSERIALDLAYIDTYSIWQDLAILSRTVKVVLTGSGIVLDRNTRDVDDLDPSGSNEQLEERAQEKKPTADDAA